LGWEGESDGGGLGDGADEEGVSEDGQTKLN